MTPTQPESVAAQASRAISSFMRVSLRKLAPALWRSLGEPAGSPTFRVLRRATTAHRRADPRPLFGRWVEAFSQERFPAAAPTGTSKAQGGSDRESSLGRLVHAVAAAAAVCAAGAAGVARAEAPRAVVQGELEPELKALIQRAIGTTDEPIETRFAARRLARAAAEDAIAALRSEGYYAYVVEPDVSDGEPGQPIVKITPGPRFAIDRPVVAWRGEAPDEATRTAADAAVDLHPQAPGRAADVIAAEGRVIATLQKRGYADATAEPREVIVDHADTSLRPTYNIASGPLVRLGAIDLRTSGRTNPAWVEKLAPWSPGEPYDPEDVAELERRLLDTSVYDSVTVSLAPPGPEPRRPVIVALADRAPRTIEAGASYSTTEGGGVDARWTHYNRMKRADSFAVFGRLSSIDSRAGVELALPHWRRAQQTLRTGATGYRLRTDAYDETGVGVRADVTRRYGRTSYVTVGGSVDASRTTELKAGTLTTLGRDLITVGTLGDLLLDRSDDTLDPTRGWKLSARGEPTVILGDENLPYLRVQTQGSTYFAFGPQRQTVLAGRVKVGRILNATVEQLPASDRFFAGGGGSVRGFGYQQVGPRLEDGTPKGGLSLFEASAEVRHDLSRRWGFAVFVDAGAVGSSGAIDFSDFAVGAGAGVRYNLGFAPIRFDVAMPVARRRGAAPFQFYVSIGQSF